jgi:hypothetical protein
MFAAHTVDVRLFGIQEDDMPAILLVVFCSLIVALICVGGAYHNRKVFENRFPPISDEEFMARCRPEPAPGSP